MDDFGRDADAEGLSFLSGAGHWAFDQAPVSVWAAQIRLVRFFFFFWGVTNGPGRTGR